MKASGWSPTSAAMTVSPCSLAARSLAIATSVGSPRSATCAAASAVVAAAIAVAHGIDASSRRHWSSATGWECTARISSSATSGGPDEAVPDREHGLAGDRERGVVEEVVRLGDGPGERALDREDAGVYLALGRGRRSRRRSSAGGRARRRPGRGDRTPPRCARRRGRGSRRSSWLSWFRASSTSEVEGSSRLCVG